MAAVIHTVFTANSAELAAAFAKASALAQKYAAERQAQGGRALASARAELEALRLEATGYSAAAAALREKVKLAEQARTLAAQAGISEANATRILERQLALRKQIAAQAAAAAAAAAQAARLASPGRSSIGLPPLPLNTSTLDAELRAAMLAREAARRRGQRGGADSASGSAMGLLAVSAAVEDAQYGIRGVINNIPQAVMAFGNFTPAAMRLAAGLSLVAVAGYAAARAGYALGADQSVLKWAEAHTSSLAAATEAYERYSDATRQRRNRDDTATRINEEREAGNRIIERGLALDQDRIQAIDKQRTALERKRSAEDAILAAAAQSGGFTGTRTLANTRNLEDTRATQDAVAAQERLTTLAREWEGLWKQTGTTSREFSDKSRDAKKELEQAASTLDILKSKQVELNLLLKAKDAYSSRDASRFMADLEAVRTQIAAREQLITDKTAEIALNDELSKQATTQGQASLEQLRQLQDAERERIEQIPQEIRLRQTLRQIEDATAAKKNQQIAAELNFQRALADTQRTVSDILEKLDRDTARASFIGDLKALKLEASGNKAGADRLREEIQLRKDAQDLAQATSITEAAAIALLREKARLHKQIADQEKSTERRRRGITRLPNGANDMNAGNNMNSWKWRLGQDSPRIGIRDTELQRRNAERSKLPRTPADDANRNLLKSVNIQEEMLKIWQKLNVV